MKVRCVLAGYHTRPGDTLHGSISLQVSRLGLPASPPTCSGVPVAVGGTRALSLSFEKKSAWINYSFAHFPTVSSPNQILTWRT